MRNASDFGGVQFGEAILPRMTLSEVCALSGQITQERVKALKARLDEEDVKGASAAVALADCESREISVQELLQFGYSPRGIKQILSAAAKKAGTNGGIFDGRPLSELREIAVRIMHLVPDRPTKALAEDSAAPQSTGQSQPSSESTQEPIPPAS